MERNRLTYGDFAVLRRSAERPGAPTTVKIKFALALQDRKRRTSSIRRSFHVVTAGA